MMIKALKITGKISFKLTSVLLVVFVFLFLADGAFTLVDEPELQNPWFVKLVKQMDEQINKFAFNANIGIVVKDLRTNEYFAINGDDTFNPASVIKVPVMIEAYHQRAIGQLSFDEMIPLKRENRVPYCGYVQFYPVGKYFRIDDLINRMIIDSDNTATNMLIEYLGMASINDYMKELGLKNTIIKDPTMLTREPLVQNSISPNDMMILLEKMYNGTLISAPASAEMLEIMKVNKHKWGIPKSLPGTVTIANKTGSLLGVRNDIGIVFDAEHPYLIAIMTKKDLAKYDMADFVRSISKIIYQTKPKAEASS